MCISLCIGKPQWLWPSQRKLMTLGLHGKASAAKGAIAYGIVVGMYNAYDQERCFDSVSSYYEFSN